MCSIVKHVNSYFKSAASAAWYLSNGFRDLGTQLRTLPRGGGGGRGNPTVGRGNQTVGGREIDL